jgi:hypothetical protein
MGSLTLLRGLMEPPARELEEEWSSLEEDHLVLVREHTYKRLHLTMYSYLNWCSDTVDMISFIAFRLYMVLVNFTSRELMTVSTVAFEP